MQKNGKKRGKKKRKTGSDAQHSSRQPLSYFPLKVVFNFNTIISTTTLDFATFFYNYSNRFFFFIPLNTLPS